jgi:hypothetical protein
MILEENTTMKLQKLNEWFPHLTVVYNKPSDNNMWKINSVVTNQVHDS